MGAFRQEEMKPPANYGSIEGQQYLVMLPPMPDDRDESRVSREMGNRILDSAAASYVSLQPLMDGDGARITPFARRQHRTWADALFGILLGFENSPLALQCRNEANNVVHTSAAADLRLGMLSNLSTAYNVMSISMALQLLAKVQHQDDVFGAVASDASSSIRKESWCSSALIAGMVCGQVAGGTLGDIFGRHRAMASVMWLQVLSALLSAGSFSVSSWSISVLDMLAFWRFMLGLGCGGVYPLSATMTAESWSQGRDVAPADRSKSVALAFAFQGIGYFLVPLITWAIVTIIPDSPALSWRLVLAFGTIPGLALTVVRSGIVPRLKPRASGEEPALDKQASQPRARAVPVSILDAIAVEKNLVSKMIGTGGCWFLFDILFDGNTLFQPMILKEAFGMAETVARTAREISITTFMALPGYFVSVYALGRLSPRTIQMQGFFIIGMLYLMIGTLFRDLRQRPLCLLIIYGMSFFFSNFGPNTTTFILPSMTFSRTCRSTLNGICAACGKVGALIGTAVFAQASARFGNEAVFFCCALLSFVGCLLTFGFVSKEADPDIAAIEEQFKGLSDAQRCALQERMAKIPLRIIYSNPSIMKHFHVQELPDGEEVRR